MTSLDESRAHCRHIARSRAKNFYYSFVLLSPEQRDAMCAVYAFMRFCDDLSDEPGANRAAIERWRDALDRALSGDPDSNPVWPAFLDAVQRYEIPRQYFYDMIEGVASDLGTQTLETFGELYRYCYRVASVVGMTVVHIFGFREGADRAEALALAEKCGIAFQLTNILRDIKEDSELGRRYLPAEDLHRFSVAPEELTCGPRSDGFDRLMDFEIARARAYYDESRPLLEMVRSKSRASLAALISIYSDLLGRIAEAPREVLRRRVALSVADKVFIVLRCAAGLG